MPKKTRSLPALAPEQWDALIDWIVEHKGDWKSKLTVAWIKASAPAPLHRLAVPTCACFAISTARSASSGATAS